MKKIIFCLVLTGSLFTNSFVKAQKSQEAATNKGDVILDLGVGFIGGDYNGYNYGNYGSAYNWNYNNEKNVVQIPTLSISVQKAFWNDVTIGGQYAFNVYGSTHDLHQSDGYYQHSKLVQSNMFFLGRGEYHFNRLIGWGPKYDLYAGALAGMRVSTSHESQIYEGWGNGQSGSWRNDYPNQSSTNVGPAGGIVGGMRYYFAGKTSVFVELGIGITVFRTGLAWRF